MHNGQGVRAVMRVKSRKKPNHTEDPSLAFPFLHSSSFQCFWVPPFGWAFFIHFWTIPAFFWPNRSLNPTTAGGGTRDGPSWRSLMAMVFGLFSSFYSQPSFEVVYLAGNIHGGPFPYEPSSFLFRLWPFGPPTSHSWRLRAEQWEE